jgi:hypothetical protein
MTLAGGDLLQLRNEACYVFNARTCHFKPPP